MKTRKKKLFASGLSLLLVLSMILGNFGNVQQAKADEPVSLAQPPQNFESSDKNISGTKTVEWVDQASGLAKVTFKLWAKKVETVQTQVTKTDVVLVLDLSGSMEDNQKLDSVKTAATSFVNSIMTEENKDLVNMGIVSYATNVTTTQSLTASKDTLVGKIDKLRIASNDNNGIGRGTNIQLGIKRAQEILAGSTNNKVMIVLSDGVPTYSLQGTALSSSLVTLNDGTAEFLLTAFNNTVKGSGSDYTFRGYSLTNPGGEKSYSYEYEDSGWWGNTYWESVPSHSSVDYTPNGTETDKQVLGLLTITSRNGGTKTRNVRIRVYSSNLTISNNGIPTISQAKLAKDAGIIVYTIGYGSDTATTDAVYTLKNSASPNKYFTDADDAAKTIEDVFDSISQEVSTTIASGKGASIVDPLPVYFTYVPGSASTAVLEANTNNTSLTWTIGEISETTQSTPYTASFNIQLDKSKLNAEAVHNNRNVITTNDSAYFQYTNVAGVLEQVKIDNPTLDYPTYNYSVTYRWEDYTDGTYNKEIKETGYAFDGASIPLNEHDVDDNTNYPDAAARYNATPVIKVNDTEDTLFIISEGAANTATVNFSLNRYTVNFYNGTELLKTEEVKHGKNATAPTEPTPYEENGTRYTFNGWNNDYKNVTQNTDVYANWDDTPIKYTVKYFDMLGNLIKSNDVDWGQPCNAPTAGFDKEITSVSGGTITFKGWSTGSNPNKDDGNITSVLQDYNIYALSDTYFTVTFYTAEKDAEPNPIFGEPIKVNSGAAVSELPKGPTKPATTTTTYAFDKWVVATEGADLTNVTRDIDVYPTFIGTAVPTYTVTYNLIDNSGDTLSFTAPAAASYYENDEVPVAVEPAINTAIYEFTGWTTEDVTLNAGKFTMPTKAVTLTGTITKRYVAPVEYKVTYAFSGTHPAVAVLPRQTTAKADDLITVASELADTDTFKFLGWFINGKPAGTSFKMPAQDVTIMGVWEPKAAAPVPATVTVNIYLNNVLETSTTEDKNIGDSYSVTYDTTYTKNSVTYNYSRTDGAALSGTVTDNIVVNLYYTYTEAEPSTPPYTPPFTPPAVVYSVTYVLTDATGDSLSLFEPGTAYYNSGDFVTLAVAPSIDSSLYEFSGWTTSDLLLDLSTISGFAMPSNNITISGTVTKLAAATQGPEPSVTPEVIPTETPVPTEVPATLVPTQPEEIIEPEPIPEGQPAEEEVIEDELPTDLPETGTVSATLLYLFAAGLVISGLAIRRKHSRKQDA